jgi:hypothetical protein
MNASAETRIDVYDGTAHVGMLRERHRKCYAEYCNGAAIGTFSDRKSAVIALIAHDRLTRRARLQRQRDTAKLVIDQKFGSLSLAEGLAPT